MNARASLVAALMMASAGCAERAKPADWPKLHASDDDGGESIAPRASAQSIAEERTERDDAPTEVSVAPTVVPPVSTTSPTAAPTAPTAGSDEPTVEDITINVTEGDGDD